ncbi:hypothetical protein MKQ68_04820 [Chitinophaga horti]|uniref:Methylamine utilisation protein MauE domain-containing protein n=1 Tax=Chitinophaga horti TaxID=2920382 RepID=A0ABY6J405_9BACT|nr:MauE/DoxX family redox-associated membrane protein [Chitinophaga horti]UYQ94410.1 hypothetical protein MKQ68_04820 [Chitinophaga horti]
MTRISLKRPVVLEFLIALIILLMVYAALNKLTIFKIFTLQLQVSPFKLLGQYSTFFAVAVPSIELIIAALFLFNRTRKIAAVLFISLMSAFTIYIAAMLVSGLDLPCSCGGVLSNMNWSTHLIFNIIYLLIGITVYIMLKRQQRFTSATSVLT